jgi:glycosyltransferase involved in cell wall biosynthesis
MSSEPGAPPLSKSHLVLIPSYNPGPKVFAAVRNALDEWTPVWVVIDGSTDQSAERLSAMAAAEPGLRVCYSGFARPRLEDSRMH